MLLALVHLTARAHPATNEPQGGPHGPFARQRVHQRPTHIPHHLRQFDQAALRVMPGEQHDQLLLQQHPDQFSIQFTQHAPGIARTPFVHLAKLFPEFVQQFHLPAFA